MSKRWFIQMYVAILFLLLGSFWPPHRFVASLFLLIAGASIYVVWEEGWWPRG